MSEETTIELEPELQAIADQLAINLSGVESVPNRTANLDAYDLFLKGRRALRELRPRPEDPAQLFRSALSQGRRPPGPEPDRRRPPSAGRRRSRPPGTRCSPRERAASR